MTLQIHAPRKYKNPVKPLFFLLFFLVLSLPACNFYETTQNKSSDKAKMEEAAIYIDKGEYEKAESILYKIYDKNPDTSNAKLLQLLSNSISGQIGLDTFSILEIIDEISDMDSSGAIDLVGLVLGDNEGNFTKAQIAEKIHRLYFAYPDANGGFIYADGAIAFLEQIGDKTLDHHAQLGLLSLIDTILLLGEILLYDLGDNTIKLTEQGIKNAYINKQYLFPYNPGTPDFVENDPPDFTRIERLSKNVERVVQSIDAILSLTGAQNPEENDLAEVFNDFLDEATDHERKITFNQLVFYITGLL